MNHLIQLELQSPFAAGVKGPVEIIQKASVVHFAKVGIAVHKSQLHSGIGDSGIECEAVVFFTNLTRIGLKRQGVVKAGEGILHIRIALVCEFLDFIDVVKQLHDVILLVCYPKKH